MHFRFMFHGRESFFSEELSPMRKHCLSKPTIVIFCIDIEYQLAFPNVLLTLYHRRNVPSSLEFERENVEDRS